VNDFKRNSKPDHVAPRHGTGRREGLHPDSARPDDQGLFKQPEKNVLRFFDSLARQINPVATVSLGATGNIGAAIGDEIAGLEKQMRGNKQSAYWGHAHANSSRDSEKLKHDIAARRRARKDGQSSLICIAAN